MLYYYIVILCDYQRVMNTLESDSSYELRYIKGQNDNKNTWFQHQLLGCIKKKKESKENLKHSSTAETKNFLDNEPESQRHYPQDQETRVNISVLHW